MYDENAIEVRNVQKKFAEKTAVQDISFTVKKGEIFGLLGPNGAGKTTLLKMVTTLLHQDTGEILLNGFNTVTERRMARQQFSVTGQTTAIDQDLSARENLLIFARLNGLSRRVAQIRAAELLTDFDLINSADQALVTFSGGMRRRLDLAVSLIGSPSILFLDEPTTGLDPRTRIQMWQAIQKLVANGSTVLLTTQYLEEADQLADRIALIDHGEMIVTGIPKELKQKVGGTKLQFEVLDLQRLSQARNIMENIVKQHVSVDDQTLIVIFDSTGMQLVNSILNQLQDSGILITNLRIVPPSLDDVFLKMTVGKN
ncbi:ATP-binding cassette domain-containing protein [Liquorilactobacillus hordei]|uniref:Abc transporteratp-binding protein n=1 Tax=Liquorilactobacillus hordei DSM 19519 TaxID=1423759 RepID=A0A0R1MJE2_9LACO|nr:ATP-binding cassette domain-containing protein [Liquorilactobacillus hordei]KRL05290.1 abc transporteratp-binding protein [Liquorilactobacillus hordei DSM 19519]QYH52875.1 ATP-binding cassette domain-containing protein [Liquorilactobacillus hordei DSM 19519]